jgi:hypothetical protein
LGSTVIATQTQTGGSATWHLSAALTVRSAGISGSVVGTVGLAHDSGAMGLWSYSSQDNTVNTTGALTLDLTGQIADFSGAERVVCEQLIIKSE